VPSLAATCSAVLFAGIVSHHRATCCLSFAPESMPPPDRAVFLTITGECRVPRFHRRRAVFGWDSNGPILFGLCRDITVYGFVEDPVPAPDVDCCLLAATGPSTPGNGYAPMPMQITGTYECPTKRGMKMGTFALKPQATR